MSYLQELQHGLANLRPQTVLQQLAFQAYGLSQVGVRLTQHVVQVQCCLDRRHVTLQGSGHQCLGSEGGGEV